MSVIVNTNVHVILMKFLIKISGKPLDNCVIYIVNKEMRLVLQGEVGELIVAGRNLATGYIRDNECCKFQDNPLAIDLGKTFTIHFGHFVVKR